MSKKDIQGYLGLYMLVGIGLVLLNLVSPPISRSFFMGLILAASGAAGFYVLDLGTQPDHENPIVGFVQRTIRSLTGDQPPPKSAPTAKSNDELDKEDKDAERKRLRSIVSFKIEAEGTKKLYTIEAWQEWRKTERQRILKLYSENSITESEMSTRFEAIDDAYDKGIQTAKGNVEIFEES